MEGNNMTSEEIWELRAKGKSWVMRLPRGLREQPAWVFIGTISSVTGLSYLLGFAQSTAINRVLDPNFLRVWGGFLLFAGSLVVYATIWANRALERLSLRFLSVGYLVYLGWVLTAAPVNRAMVTTVACVSLIGLAEIRVAVLKAAMKPLPIVVECEPDK
jgi:hypothetical protein